MNVGVRNQINRRKLIDYRNTIASGRVTTSNQVSAPRHTNQGMGWKHARRKQKKKDRQLTPRPHVTAQ